ncbi:MAG TPA: hypothetical protein VEL79_13805 [Vicinamibacterales bacterium]|nr:hypothetical protein [Vicinamibacterales bacterium]
MLHPKPVHLARELVAELLKEILAEELVMQRTQHPSFDFVATNGQVVIASSLVTRAEAPEPVLRRHDESGAADAAFRQTREQVLRPLRHADGARCLHSMPGVSLTRLRSRPDFVRHQPQFRDFPRRPLGCRVEPRHALSGVRILHVAKPIPDQAADVQLVVKNAGSALRVAVDGARTPRATERAWYARTIQVLGDLLR